MSPRSPTSDDTFFFFHFKYGRANQQNHILTHYIRVKALWTQNGPTCNWILRYEKLWCCGHAALVRTNPFPLVCLWRYQTTSTYDYALSEITKSQTAGPATWRQSVRSVRSIHRANFRPAPRAHTQPRQSSPTDFRR